MGLEMFSNWMFWVSLIVIISLFALIGYISDSKRRKMEERSSYEKPILPLEKNEEENINSNVSESVGDSTLNLDNGTWDNTDENVQTTGVESPDSDSSLSTDDFGEQSASDIFTSDDQEPTLTDSEEKVSEEPVDGLNQENEVADLNQENEVVDLNQEATLEDISKENVDSDVQVSDSSSESEDNSEVWKM